MQPSPLWTLEFEDEARYYFFDNDPYTFELLAEVIKLSYYSDPLEGTVQLEGDPAIYSLATHEHTVFFTFEQGLIQVLAVKPD